MNRQSVRRSIEWVKLYLQRIPWLYQLVMRWKSRRVGSLLVRRHKTRIVIEAFPRSSNSFGTRLFQCANPELEYEEVAHHAHIVSNVIHAVRWGIPALVIIRNPVDAIASNMVAVGDTSDAMARLLARKYRDFYEWVEANREKVVLARFEEVTAGRFRAIAQEINRRFDVDFNCDFDEDELAQAARDKIKEASPHRDDASRIPIPTEYRQSRYDELRPRVEANSGVPEALALYERLVRTC